MLNAVKNLALLYAFVGFLKFLRKCINVLKNHGLKASIKSALNVITGSIKVSSSE